MTRKHYRKHKWGGGVLPDWMSNNSSWMPSSFSNWNPFSTKKEETSYTPPLTTSYTPLSTSAPPPTPTYDMPMGGKKRRFRRGKRGGSYSSNISHSNLAASAESWTGGKTKKRHKFRRNKSFRR